MGEPLSSGMRREHRQSGYSLDIPAIADRIGHMRTATRPICLAALAAMVFAAGCGSDESSSAGLSSSSRTTTRSALTTSSLPTGDAGFIRTLEVNGIDVQGSPSRFVSGAAAVCSHIEGLEYTTPPTRIHSETVAYIADVFDSAPVVEMRVLGNIAAADAFVDAAIKSYCPQYTKYI
ncbi:DUF732 domain-containing protein [Aldersonia sp. NBC_00410]|uniref:DUF732 domain-containing protein n=1 Tax=Aldersonia sp. NBC_00410 TaxID=2975954 RepID=UPI0033901CB8